MQNDGLRFVRYVYEGDAELQHVKVIGGNHSWYNNANQYDIGYLTEIRKFFSTGGGNVGLTETGPKGLRLYPNPTSGQCVVELDAPSSIEIIDLQGRKLLTRLMDKGINRLDLSGFPEGLYFVKSADGAVAKLLVRKD